MSRKLKELMVHEMSERFAGLHEAGCVVVGVNRLTGGRSAEVRRALAEKDAEMTVVRNRLFLIAMRDLGVSGIEHLVQGPTAIITGKNPVQAARAAREALAGVEGLEVRGAFAEGRVLDQAGVDRLADLPGRDVLLAQVVTCMSSPAQRFAACLQAAVRRVVSVFDQLRKKREEQSNGQ